MAPSAALAWRWQACLKKGFLPEALGPGGGGGVGVGGVQVRRFLSWDAAEIDRKLGLSSLSEKGREEFAMLNIFKRP